MRFAVRYNFVKMLRGRPDANNENDTGEDEKTSDEIRSSPTTSITKSTGTNEMKKASKDMVGPLPESFQPGEFDVICSRGKDALSSPGNVRYKTMIKDNLDRYSATTTKQAKSAIVTEIVQDIQEKSPEGGFVRNVKGTWHVVSNHIAREKTGQCFRDALHTKYKSSTKAKRKRMAKERRITSLSASTKMAEPASDARIQALSEMASQVFDSAIPAARHPRQRPNQLSATSSAQGRSLSDDEDILHAFEYTTGHLSSSQQQHQHPQNHRWPQTMDLNGPRGTELEDPQDESSFDLEPLPIDNPD